MMIGIGSAAALLGVAVVTLRRWGKLGILIPHHRTPGGHRRYDDADVLALSGEMPEAPLDELPTIAYARVSGHSQKGDLERQKERLVEACGERGWPNVEVIADLGSGLNFSKKGLLRLLHLICRRGMKRLVVTHKDRLLRFGASLLFQICGWFGIDVVVLDDAAETNEERLAADVIELLTVFAARIHGRRSHDARKAKQAGKTLPSGVPEQGLASLVFPQENQVLAIG